MAQGDGRIQNKAKADILAGLVNLAASGHVIKFVLCSGAVPSIDGTVLVGDLTQISASGYLVKTLANQSVAQDDTGNQAVFDGDDIEWTGLGTPTQTLTHAGAYDDTHASKIVLATWDLVTQPNGGNYKLAFATAGIITAA